MNWNLDPQDHAYVFAIPDGTYAFNSGDADPYPTVKQRLTVETGDEIGWLESLWKMESPK